MKKTSFILGILILSIVSCKKDSGGSSGAGGGALTGKSFYCKFDGTDFTPSNGGRFYSTTGTGIQIVGDDANHTVEIYLTSSAVASYTLVGNSGGVSNNFAGFYITAGNKQYVSSTGTVKITKSDGTKISGTFEYTAANIQNSSDVVHVTNGEFNDIVKQ